MRKKHLPPAMSKETKSIIDYSSEDLARVGAVPVGGRRSNGEHNGGLNDDNSSDSTSSSDLNMQETRGAFAHRISREGQREEEVVPEGDNPEDVHLEILIAPHHRGDGYEPVKVVTAQLVDEEAEESRIMDRLERRIMDRLPKAIVVGLSDTPQQNTQTHVESRETTATRLGLRVKTFIIICVGILSLVVAIVLAMSASSQHNPIQNTKPPVPSEPTQQTSDEPPTKTPSVSFPPTPPSMPSSGPTEQMPSITPVQTTVVPDPEESSFENEQTGLLAGNSTTVEIKNSTTEPVAPEGWITLGQDLYGKTWHDQYGSAVAVSSNGQRIVACARWPEFFTRVYEFDTENWSWKQLGDELPYGASEGVAIDQTGHRVVIGDYTSGGARVFDWTNSNWVENAHVGVGLIGEPVFLGISLSMSVDGNRVALGDGLSQQAYIFEETEGGSWVQIGDSLSGCRYPVGISGDGRRAIVGGENAATVYEWNDFQWVQVGQTLSDEGTGGDYGSPIAISRNGNVVAVAATRANGGAAANGIVRVYHLVDNNWLQLGGDIVGESPYDGLGTAVALSGNGTRIAIGAAFAEPGYVRVYEWNTLQWIKIGIEIKDSQYNYFGEAVDLSGDGEVVVAGDWSYICKGGNCGFVRAFRFMHRK